MQLQAHMPGGAGDAHSNDAMPDDMDAAGLYDAATEAAVMDDAIVDAEFEEVIGDDASFGSSGVPGLPVPRMPAHTPVTVAGTPPAPVPLFPRKPLHLEDAGVDVPVLQWRKPVDAPDARVMDIALARIMEPPLPLRQRFCDAVTLSVLRTVTFATTALHILRWPVAGATVAASLLAGAAVLDINLDLSHAMPTSAPAAIRSTDPVAVDGRQPPESAVPVASVDAGIAPVVAPGVSETVFTEKNEAQELETGVVADGGETSEATPPTEPAAAPPVSVDEPSSPEAILPEPPPSEATKAGSAKAETIKDVDASTAPVAAAPSQSPEILTTTPIPVKPDPNDPSTITALNGKVLPPEVFGAFESPKEVRTLLAEVDRSETLVPPAPPARASGRSQSASIGASAGGVIHMVIPSDTYAPPNCRADDLACRTFTDTLPADALPYPVRPGGATLPRVIGGREYSLTSWDLERFRRCLALVAYAQAPVAKPVAKLAVMYTVLNRAATDGFRNDPCRVVSAQGQYEAMDRGPMKPETDRLLRGLMPRWPSAGINRDSLRSARSVAWHLTTDHSVGDPTKGALYMWPLPNGAKPEDVVPRWALGLLRSEEIGGLVFLRYLGAAALDSGPLPVQ